MLYLFCFCQGMLAMGFQFLLAKHMTPSFGSSIITWAALISATTTAYAAGSFLSSRIVRRMREDDLKLLISCTLLMVGAYGALGSVAILASVTYLPYYLALCLVVIAFAIIPITGLSCLVPLLLSLDPAVRKSDVGTVFGFVSLGNLVGALGTTFGLLPFLDLLLLRWIWLSCILGLLIWWGIMLHQRVSWAVFFGFLLVIPDYLFHPTLTGAIATNLDFYGWSVVVDKGDKRQLLTFYDGGLGIQSSTSLHEPTLPTDNRVELLTHLARTAPPRHVLQFGLGGGNLNMALRRLTPRPEVLTLEINPNMVRLATQYFSWQPDAKDQVTIADGRYYLTRGRNRQTYDLIVLDAFTGDSVPEHLRTYEFYLLLHRYLKPEGYVAVNLPTYRRVNAWDLHTVVNAFPYVYIQTVSNLQVWVYASLSPHPGWGERITLLTLAGSKDPWFSAAARAGTLQDSFNPSPYLQRFAPNWN